MKNVVLASRNKGKIKEMAEILKPLGFNVVTMDDVGLADFDIIEDGDTFHENSYKKAFAISKKTGMAAIADDSGLEVDCLGGIPGVHSARYAGEGATDSDNRKKLLIEMENIPDGKRTARFVCVITMIVDDKVLTFRGECEGEILKQEQGDGGFGYDSLFLPKGYDKSFAEIPFDEKNKISHRAKALKHLKYEL